MSETYFIKEEKTGNYTKLDNTCIQDRTISWKAKGIHTYLMSLPNDWKVYMSEIVNHSTDGKSALYSAIKELENHGYIVKKQKRRDDGCFGPLVYYVYENPNECNRDLLFTNKSNSNQPIAIKANTNNHPLLITNKQNTKIQKTKLTNYEETGSESVFVNLIRKLFSDKYPFDKNFESGVLSELTKFEIEEDNLESYLEYVFKRTESINPKKSFEGLFWKLALADSVLRDFKLGNNAQSKKVDAEVKPLGRVYECPICHTSFNEYEPECPTCSLSVESIKKNDELEITIHRKTRQMSEEERVNYETAYRSFLDRIGRGFALREEKIRFHKEYGILN